MKDRIIVRLLSKPKAQIMIPFVPLKSIVISSLPIIGFTLMLVQNDKDPGSVDMCLAALLTVVCIIVAIKVHFGYRIVRHYDSICLVDDKGTGLNELALAVLEIMIPPSKIDVDLDTLTKIRVLSYNYWRNLLSTVTYYRTLNDIETLEIYLQPLVDRIRMLIEEQKIKTHLIRECKIRQNLLTEV